MGFMMSGVMTNEVIMSGMMTGVRLDGTKVVNKRVTIPQAHFHVEVLISVPRVVQSGLELVKMVLDKGAAVNTFQLPFGPDGSGDGRFYLIASGEWVLDGGAWQFQGDDMNGLHRSLNGRFIDVHSVLCSAAETARKGRQDFFLGHDGGYIQIWSRNEISF